MKYGYKKPIKDVLYTFYNNPVSRFLYEREINKRSKLPLTKITPLSQEINLFAPASNEPHPPNNWYGHAKIFKQFLGLPENYQFKFIIEHGLHLTEDMLNIELESNLPSVITYSNFRANIIKQYGKQAFCIGPFIHYAPHFLSAKELLSEKKRLGKCLLLFPSHSTGDLAINYNINQLCKKVKKLGKDYDSIRVCLYWKEVLSGRAKYYQDFGFECITAGHILDPLFLSRLKSIIETANATVSNAVGNHIGYSVFVGKPHIIIPQKQTVEGRKSERILIENFWWKSKPAVEIVKAFVKITDQITPHQRSIVNYYWGIDNIKTKRKFMDIIRKTEQIYKLY